MRDALEEALERLKAEQDKCKELQQDLDRSSGSHLATLKVIDDDKAKLAAQIAKQEKELQQLRDNNNARREQGALCELCPPACQRTCSS